MQNRQDKGITRSTGRARLWMVLAASAGLFSAGAEAAFTMTIAQVGADVVANGSGSLNLAALALTGTAGGSASINAHIADLAVGPIAMTNEDPYSGITGPASVGPGAAFAAADSFTVIIGAAPASTSVPTLSQWAQVLLGLLLAAGALLGIQRGERQ